MNLRLENSWEDSDGAWKEGKSRQESVDGIKKSSWETIGAVDDGVEIWTSDRTPQEWQAHPDAEYRAEFDDFIEPAEASFPVAQRFEDPRCWVDCINPRWEGSEGPYGINCADCARCVERTWRGSGEVAAGLLKAKGEIPWRYEQWAGPFEDVGGAEAIALLDQGGAGASAYIVSSTDSWGHAYNLINHEGEVLLVDGQIGYVESAQDLLDGHHEFYLHPEAQHRASFWDSKGEKLWLRK